MVGSLGKRRISSKRGSDSAAQNEDQSKMNKTTNPLSISLPLSSFQLERRDAQFLSLSCWKARGTDIKPGVATVDVSWCAGTKDHVEGPALQHLIEIGNHLPFSSVPPSSRLRLRAYAPRIPLLKCSPNFFVAETAPMAI